MDCLIGVMFVTKLWLGMPQPKVEIVDTVVECSACIYITETWNSKQDGAVLFCIDAPAQEGKHE